jgi:hypothetical protein
VSKLLSPNRVRELMSQYAQPVVVERKPRSKSGKIKCAYEMLTKSNSTLRAASQSWGVAIASIRQYAKDNHLPFVWTADGLVEQAKQLVASGNYKNVRHGLRTRVAYELAKTHGVSQACRMAGTTRRGLYYYCERYQLPTPLRLAGVQS